MEAFNKSVRGELLPALEEAKKDGRKDVENRLKWRHVDQVAEEGIFKSVQTVFTEAERKWKESEKNPASTLGAAAQDAEAKGV